MTPADRVTRILNEAVGRDLTSWERHQFLKTVQGQRTLSEKQERILREIEERLGLPEAQ